jgi:hypothetical protein
LFEGLSFANGVIMLKTLSERFEVLERSSFDEAPQLFAAGCLVVCGGNITGTCYSMLHPSIIV